LSPATTDGEALNGEAVVVHAAAADEKTDPTGTSGARITGGVITK